MAKNEVTTEPKSTQYLIYETSDEGLHLELRGSEIATSSEQAYRQFLDRPANKDLAGVFAAVSVTYCRFRKRDVEQTVKATTTEIAPPPVDAVAPTTPTVEVEAEVEEV